MQSNLTAPPANSFSERTLFDFVPCNVNAIPIDESRRRGPADVSPLGVSDKQAVWSPYMFT